MSLEGSLPDLCIKSESVSGDRHTTQRKQLRSEAKRAVIAIAAEASCDLASDLPLLCLRSRLAIAGLGLEPSP